MTSERSLLIYNGYEFQRRVFSNDECEYRVLDCGSVLLDWTDRDTAMRFWAKLDKERC